MSLITTISQLRLLSTISISNSLENWQPYIDEAQESFIRPLLGDDLMDLLESEANSSASEESQYAGLIEKVIKPLGLYSLWLGVDEMSVSVSSSGIQVIESPSHKQAPRYMIVNLKERWLSRAHVNADLMLKFLEKSKSDYPLWINQDSDLFISNAIEFNKYVNIRESRRVFLALKPVMRSIEKKYIRATLGEDLFNELKEAINNSASEELSSDNQALVDLICPAIAHLSMARALHEISVDVLDWGVFETATSSFDDIKSKSSANSERIASMIEVNQHDGDAEIKELQEYLDNNACSTKYAAYFNCDLYQGPDYAEKKNQFVNTADKGIFVA